MGRDRDKDDKSGKGGLDFEDFQLWKAFTHDIDPLDAVDWTALEEMIQQETKAKKPPAFPLPAIKGASATAPSAIPTTTISKDQPPQLDLRTELRLRRGKMPIEATLDLHGLTQDQAHGRINDFIARAYKDQKRCVLVITGKGRGADNGAGILKTKLPQWLSQPPVRDMVLKFITAAPKDGGGGAWYLYLKRHRYYQD